MGRFVKEFSALLKVMDSKNTYLIHVFIENESEQVFVIILIPMVFRQPLSLFLRRLHLGCLISNYFMYSHFQERLFIQAGWACFQTSYPKWVNLELNYLNPQ